MTHDVAAAFGIYEKMARDGGNRFVRRVSLITDAVMGVEEESNSLPCLVHVVVHVGSGNRCSVLQRFARWVRSLCY